MQSSDAGVIVPAVVPSVLPRTHYFVILFYATAAVWGVRSAYYWEPSHLDWIMTPIQALTLGWWAVTDARRRGRPMVWPARLAFVVLGGILAPIYFIWTRGWRGLGWVVLHAVGWWLVATVALHAAGSIAYGGAWWEAM